MKKISSIGLCLLFFLAWTVFLFSLPARAFAEENSPPEILGEEHTSELGLSEEYIGYYGIDSASDLLWFMDAASLEGGIRALLLSDIVINENLVGERLIIDPHTGEPTVKSSAQVTEWIPIGSFSGVLDGGGHSIEGLYIKSDGDSTGIIGTLTETGVVRNLTLTGSYIYSTGDFTGSAVGTNFGLVSSVHNLSDVVSAGKYTGGIVGKNGGAVSACSNGWNVQGTDFVGGIAGQNSGIITHSYSAYGNDAFCIFGEKYIGGIAGESRGEIGYCYSASSLLGDAEIFPVVGRCEYGIDLYSNYYLGDRESDSMSGTSCRTKTAFLSGEVAYLLNMGGENFYQTIGAEMPSFSGDRVYLNHRLICPGDDNGTPFYSNTYGNDILNPNHVTSGGCDEKCNICETELNVTKMHTFVNNCDEFCDICDTYRIPPHSYINSCDTHCGDCGETREAVHIYSGLCDEICNACHREREVGPHSFIHPCSLSCSICGAENLDVLHTYNGACDTVCRFCDSIRDVSHLYDNNCDGICNLCERERTVADHVYRNACDSVCDECGFVRITPEHQYNNNCDKTCGECGFLREVGEHIFDNSCDRVCNECKTERAEIAHSYDNPCDSTCNNCEFMREAGAHVYSDGCDPDCNFCGEVRSGVSHTYDNSCDAQCNRCGYIRTDIAHTYNSPCDADCNICKSVRDYIEHTYENACDTNCNICGFMRESAEHIFGEYRVSIEPTRSEEGQERRRCTICGAEEFRAIPRLEIPKSEKLFFFGVVAAVMAFITSVAIVIRKRL